MNRDGEVQVCNECGKNSYPAYSAEQLGQLLEPLLRERIGFGDQRRVFSGPDDDKGWWEQVGDSIELFVSEFIGQDISFLDDVICAVSEAENAWPPDGDEPFFDSCSNYVRVSYHSNTYIDRWHSIETEITQAKRFFSEAARSFFGSLFQEIDQLEAPTADGIEKVVRNFPVGTVVHRARLLQSNNDTLLQSIFDDPIEYAGPPPSNKANAGRMNAAGIVMLYAALDHQTALAELRPSLGSDVAVIEICLDKRLRLLDFKRLENAFTSISAFDPNYTDKSEKHTFLRQIHRLISRPVLPGKESEYLMTQTMAEYLSHVHERPFDGILFSSAQNRDGTNIVIFADEDGGFPISYVHDSMTVSTVNAVKHDLEERLLIKVDGKVSLAEYDSLYEDEF
ncbi:RES family NAD+ phosphorylase [Pseudohalioglobus lutimaris]|uniref:RES family NAD+ phosphorylase n=1 Tax=Pseudohalioglobus lutimaris TaxID=1737061 RepID=UPI0013FDFB8E|nr:RES family NAD+ phosphorylase [Pseudohalioglobus lutimaris]